MKRKYNYIIAAAFLVVFTGCDLGVVDKTAVLPATVYTTLAGSSSGINSQYRHVNDFDYRGQTINVGPEILADNMQIVNRTGRYEQEYINAVGTFMNIWNGRYTTINEANFAIANIKPIPLVPATSTNQLLGEAYFHRALAYFDLLRVYAYEPGKEQGGFSLGVIIRTTPTNTLSDAEKKARGTNLEGYTLVESDLQTAIGLLNDPATTVDPLAASPAPSQFPYRASKQAAYALLAKVYLHWGRYADAATQADLALAYATGPLTTAANFATAYGTSPHQESFFESEIRSTDWSSVDGANNSMCSLTTIGLYTGAQYVVAASDELINAHEVGDIRKNIYLNTAATLNKPMARKWLGEKGTFLENILVIRRAEVILISAEGKARSGNFGGAATTLNTLRTNRGLTATVLTGQPLLDLILNERRVELAFEGNRWFDLKRLGLPVTKPAVSGASTLPASDFRVLQQIPNAEIVLNPLLKQNPGY